MGNRFNKHLVSLSRNRDIISEKSLRSLFEVIAYLKLNVRSQQMFQATGYQRRVRQIAAYISTGADGIHDFLLDRAPVEVAAGLQYFLVRLPKPLLPLYIQTLALDVGNDVQPELVAADILGLIAQDIKGRQLTLITILLNFLFFIRKYATNDELSGSDIPVTMMPIFFSLQTEHFQKWRTIAGIFMEMIDLAPSMLAEDDNRSDSPEDSMSDRFRFYDEPQAAVQDLALENDDVLHRILMRTGHEGDTRDTQIIRLVRNRMVPTMINPVFGYLRRRFR